MGSHSKLAATGASILAVALLAGCGGGDDENAKTVTVTTTVKEQVAAVPESLEHKNQARPEGDAQTQQRPEGQSSSRFRSDADAGEPRLRERQRRFREGEHPILDCVRKYGGFVPGESAPPESSKERHKNIAKIRACIRKNDGKVGDRFGGGYDGPDDEDVPRNPGQNG